MTKITIAPLAAAGLPSSPALAGTPCVGVKAQIAVRLGAPGLAKHRLDDVAAADLKPHDRRKVVGAGQAAPGASSARRG